MADNKLGTNLVFIRAIPLDTNGRFVYSYPINSSSISEVELG